MRGVLPARGRVRNLRRSMAPPQYNKDYGMGFRGTRADHMKPHSG